MTAAANATPRMKTFRRWCRFNLVGGIGIAVQLSLLYGLKSIFHLNYLLATALAVEAAVIHNFLWHERFTWMEHVRPSWNKSAPRFLRFNLANGAISIGGNLALMKFMVGIGHMHYMVANTAAIGICSLVNFVVSDNYVFGKECKSTG
jgi:putative flippase GtrA